VRPKCFAQPHSASDVSKIILLAKETQCKFAVKSGGHAAFDGASNIQDGITIDLQLLNELSINEDKTITRIGPGNRWIDVYEYLTPLGVSVVGGRDAEIGVGGLTLGGGISWYSGRYGWAADGVRNYEVVMADGEIREVSLESYPDLYWALRGGGNNFGVVTRYVRNRKGEKGPYLHPSVQVRS
jgi:FAD/FMN-containing dehydrogenase